MIPSWILEHFFFFLLLPITLQKNNAAYLHNNITSKQTDLVALMEHTMINKFEHCKSAIYDIQSIVC